MEFLFIVIQLLLAFVTFLLLFGNSLCAGYGCKLTGCSFPFATPSHTKSVLRSPKSLFSSSLLNLKFKTSSYVSSSPSAPPSLKLTHFFLFGQYTKACLNVINASRNPFSYALSTRIPSNLNERKAAPYSRHFRIA